MADFDLRFMPLTPAAKTRRAILQTRMLAEVAKGAIYPKGTVHPYGTWYANLLGLGYAWKTALFCDQGACWLHREDLDLVGGPYAWTVGHLRRGRQLGCVIERSEGLHRMWPGDLPFFKFGAEGREEAEVDHIGGFVITPPNSTGAFRDGEFNTIPDGVRGDQTAGRGVHVRTRDITTSDYTVVGALRPRWHLIPDEQMADLQGVLNRYYGAELTVDGKPGQSTRQATATAQATLNVRPDAIWGEASQAAHEAKVAPKPVPPPPAPPPPAPKPVVIEPKAPKGIRASLATGRNAPVLTRVIEHRIRRWTNRAPTGVFDKVVDAGVREWQRALGVKPDGVVGPATFRADLERSAARYGPPKRGDNGNSVRLVQYVVGVDPDGDFGAATELNVKRCQKGAGIEPDGVFGRDARAELLVSP